MRNTHTGSDGFKGGKILMVAHWGGGSYLLTPHTCGSGRGFFRWSLAGEELIVLITKRSWGRSWRRGTAWLTPTPCGLFWNVARSKAPKSKWKSNRWKPTALEEHSASVQGPEVHRPEDKIRHRQTCRIGEEEIHLGRWHCVQTTPLRAVPEVPPRPSATADAHRATSGCTMARGESWLSKWWAWWINSWLMLAINQFILTIKHHLSLWS